LFIDKYIPKLVERYSNNSQIHHSYKVKYSETIYLKNQLKDILLGIITNFAHFQREGLIFILLHLFE